MLDTINQHIESIVIVIAIVVAITTAMKNPLDMPTVYESYSLNTCIKVESVNGNDSCALLPDRYTHIWVQ